MIASHDICYIYRVEAKGERHVNVSSQNQEVHWMALR